MCRPISFMDLAKYNMLQRRAMRLFRAVLRGRGVHISDGEADDLWCVRYAGSFSTRARDGSFCKGRFPYVRD
jgi:hypothetical protein